MLQQKLQNPRPDALRGVGTIALTALAVFAGSAAFSRLSARIGSLASLGFIAYGCFIAWWLLDRYILAFSYTATADVLRVCRVYGKRERFMADVYLSTIRAWGSEEDMKRRFPGARVERATRDRCALQPLALAYTFDGKTMILVIQPDEAMRRHLTGRDEEVSDR